MKPLQAYFFTGGTAGAFDAAAGAFGAAAGAAVLEVPGVVFTAGFMACFLECFFTLVVAAGAALPLAGGVAGVCAAKVKGSVAKARAMVIKVVFIFVYLPCGLLVDARSQSHHAA